MQAFSESRTRTFASADLSQLSPEKVLAALSQNAPHIDLLVLLTQEFKVDRIRFGSRFAVANWPYHVLTLKKPKGIGDKALAAYTLELSRFLFEEKRRQLRFVLRPDRYLADLDRLTTQLEEIVYPALAILHPDTLVESRQRWSALRMSLRSLFMISPSTRQIWPLSGGDLEDRKSLNFRRQSLHWGISRTMAAIYLSMLAMTISHIPDNFETFQLLYRMRGDMIELGNEMGKGAPYDRRAERLKLIEKYEARILTLEKQLLNENADPERLKKTIAELRQAIESLRSELKQ